MLDDDKVVVVRVLRHGFLSKRLAKGQAHSFQPGKVKHQLSVYGRRTTQLR